VKNALSYVSGAAPPELNLPATGEEILLRLAGYESNAQAQPEGCVKQGSNSPTTNGSPPAVHEESAAQQRAGNKSLILEADGADESIRER
jgi:hypothetical protein